MKSELKERYIEKYKKYAKENEMEFDEKSAREVLDLIEKLNVNEKMLDISIGVLGTKPSKFENILKTADELKLNRDIFVYNPKLFKETNVTRIKENINLLKKNKINLSILEFFPDIIGNGKASDMAKIIKYINESEIVKIDPDFILKNGDVIAQSKPAEFKKVIKVLKEENIFEDVVKKCPQVLYMNKAKTIKEILDLFRTSEILEEEKIYRNLDILAESTKVRINAIINLLKRLGIDPTMINQAPKMLYMNSNKDIEKIILKLRNMGFSNDNIYYMYDFFSTPNERRRQAMYDELEFIKENSRFLRKIMFKNPRVVLDLNMEKAIKFQEEIAKGRLKERYIEEVPEIMLKKEPEDIINVLNALEVSGIKGYEDKNPEIFLIEDPGNIIKIVDIIKENNISKLAILESSDIFLKIEPEELKKNIEILKDKNIDIKNASQNMLLNLKTNEVNKKAKEKPQIKENKKEEQKEQKQEENKLDINPELKEKLEEIDITEKNISEKLNMSIEELSKAKTQARFLDIFEYFEDIGISKALKNGYDVLKMNLKDIKTNMDIFIEIGLFKNIAFDLNALNINKLELEKRINLLKKNITLDFDEIVLNKEEFLEKNNISEKEFDEQILEDYAQFNISNKYKKYLNIDPRQMYLKESKVYENIYKDILDLGNVNNNLEYIKCGEKFSILKIEENLHKIIVGISDNENLDIYNLSDFDKNEIIALTILGRRRLDEKMSSEIYDSILKGENEKDWEKRNKVLKEEIRKEIKQEEKLKEEKAEKEQKEEVCQKISIIPAKEDVQEEITENKVKIAVSPEDVFEKMQKMYDDGSLKLDKNKILNENELVIPEYEEKLQEERRKEKELRLKEIEENIKSNLKELEEKEQKELKENSNFLESIKNTFNFSEDVPSDPNLIILENMQKEQNIVEDNLSNFKKSSENELYLGLMLKEEQKENTNDENINKLNVGSSNKNMENLDFSLERLENEITKELELQNNKNNQNVEIKFEDFSNNISDLQSISLEKNIKTENIENKNLNEDKEILNMLEKEREARTKLENEIESLKKMQEDFLRSLSLNEKEKQNKIAEEAKKEDLEKLKIDMEMPKSLEINLEKPNFEKDMIEGSKKDYSEFEKNLSAITIDPETLIKSNLEKVNKNKEEDFNEFSKMENNLEKSLENFKMFSLESEQRRANFEARKRKKIQEIRDRRARNKTLEEASKLEETARKLKEQAEALESERQKLREEKELELERIRKEQEETSKALEEEKLKLQKERELELEKIKKEKEEALKAFEEEERLKEEIRKQELENLRIEQEKKIANLVKEEAQKIIEKQGLMDLKEEYEKLKQDLTIEKMYKDQKEEKEKAKEINETKQEELKKQETENVKEEIQYPENISDFKANTSPSLNFNSNILDEENNNMKMNNVSPRDFFDLEDYGYLTQMVDSKEAEKMKASMNLIFKKKKEDYANI